MIARTVVHAAVVIAAAGSSAWPAAAAGPRGLEAAPAGLREQVLLAGALVGGSRLDLNRFEDTRSPEAVISAVEAAWSDRPAPIRRDIRDGWLTLVQAIDAAVEVLEVRAAPRGGSEGRRSRWQGAGSGSARPAAWLEDTLPAGSHVLQRVTHQDGGRQTTTLVAVTASALSSAVGQLVAALEGAGFEGPSRTLPAFRGHGEAFILQRGSEEVAVTVSELDGRRAVVLHWGKRSP